MLGRQPATSSSVDGRPQHGFNVRAFPTPMTLVFELLGLNRLWPSNPVNRRYRVQIGLDTSAWRSISRPEPFS